MTLTFRSITDDEVPAYRLAMMTTFGEDAHDADPDGDARLRALVPTERMWAAFDGPQIVATAGTHDIALGVPGGATVPMAGLTMVSVRPTHRRRGILRELMALHLADARARGFAIGGLWASEASIYRRFGYGLASLHDSLEIHDAHSVRFADSWADANDPLQPVEEAEARQRLPAIYAGATADRPGTLRRGEVWWRERRFLETPFTRRGASRRRHVIARRAGEDIGYIQYRQRPAFPNNLPGGRVEIIELFGIDARAEASLWKFALSIDLFPVVAWWCAPVDCPLPWMLADWRRAARKRLDNLWLRIDDIPAALAARGYTHQGRLRFAVDGTRWELNVEGGSGRCTSTTESPQFELDAAALGSLYLGGITASELARAGQVRGDAMAITLADCLFGSVVAPWCPEVF